MPKERIAFRVDENTINFFKNRKERTGESFSEILDKIVIQHQMKSEEFMEQFSDMLFEKFKPML